MKNSPEYSKVVWIFLVMVILLGVVWISKNSFLGGPKAYEFTGTLHRFDNDILVVNGIYSVESEVPQEVKEVKIIIEPDTKITRRLLTLPTQEELEKTGGRFDPESLDYVESQVGLDTLKSDSQNSGIGLEVKSDVNIYNDTTIHASEIYYRAVIYP